MRAGLNRSAAATLFRTVSGTALILACGMASPSLAETYYVSTFGQLSSAFSAASADANSTIILTQNITIGSNLSSLNKNVTIDTNGFTITGLTAVPNTGSNLLTLQGIFRGTTQAGAGGTAFIQGTTSRASIIANTGSIAGGASTGLNGGLGVSLAGGGVEFTNNGTISGGNPALRPEYTWGADASIEYYLPGNGMISVAGFHRWVDNVLYQNQAPVDTDFYNFGGIDRSGYLLSGTYNGESGKLYGVEFNLLKQFDFLPGALDGFGFQGNVTLLDGSFDTPTEKGIAFQGMSKTIANASLFYEKYGISARVSYQWRSHWLDTLGGMGSGEYRQGYENLDGSLRYELTKNLTLFADLANLTNEKYIAYQGTPATPTEVEQIGSRYLFGVRFGF